MVVRTTSGEVIYSSSKLIEYKSPKDIVFTKNIHALDLILESWVSTSDIETVLEQKKQDYEDKIIGFILKIYMLTLFLYLISTIEYKYASEIMGREIRFIVESLKAASQNYHTINMEKINFKEFREISSHANFMLDKIKEKNSALVELNNRLEELVAQKTQELKKSVDFTQELLENKIVL